VANGSTTAAATLTLGSDNNSQLFIGTFVNGSTQPLGLTKTGGGTFSVSGDSTCTGPVTVQAGTLALVAASGSFPNSTPVTGTGSFSNATAIAVATGATLDVSGRSDGTLTLNANQTLKHSGASVGQIGVTGNVNSGSGILLLALNRTNSPATNDSLVVSGTLTAGGTLTVTNLGPALHANDSFQLFNSGVSGFAYNLQTNDYVNNVKYTWLNTVSTDGKIMVQTVGSLVNTNPTNITASVSGGNLTLSWPADHIGWTLQSQTNTSSIGLGTNWTDIAGSSTINQVVIPINTVSGSVFFRMKY
jgi:autotransporter-associated beta strand protein